MASVLSTELACSFVELNRKYWLKIDLLHIPHPCPPPPALSRFPLSPHNLSLSPFSTQLSLCLSPLPSTFFYISSLPLIINFNCPTFPTPSVTQNQLESPTPHQLRQALLQWHQPHQRWQLRRLKFSLRHRSPAQLEKVWAIWRPSWSWPSSAWRYSLYWSASSCAIDSRCLKVRSQKWLCGFLRCKVPFMQLFRSEVWVRSLTISDFSYHQPM